jgi:hypothetical protein
MSAGSIAARGRVAAERIMVDTCRIYTMGIGGTFNPTTGEITDATTNVYTGKCRVKQVPGYKTGGELVGESVVPRTAPIITIPHEVNDVRAGMRVEVITSADESLIGRPLLIESVHAGTHATARRLVCQGLN